MAALAAEINAIANRAVANDSARHYADALKLYEDVVERFLKMPNTRSKQQLESRVNGYMVRAEQLTDYLEKQRQDKIAKAGRHLLVCAMKGCGLNSEKSTGASQSKFCASHYGGSKKAAAKARSLKTYDTIIKGKVSGDAFFLNNGPLVF